MKFFEWLGYAGWYLGGSWRDSTLFRMIALGVVLAVIAGVAWMWWL